MVGIICEFILWLKGWTYESVVPKDVTKYVVAGGPHTSNWDFLTAMAVMRKSGIPPKFLIKKSWMGFPLGPFFRAVGGVSVDREAIKAGTISSSTDELGRVFSEMDRVALWISPEGTRSPVTKWKTGFYWIAKKNNLPIVLAYADHVDKKIGLGKMMYPGDDPEKDFMEIMDFFRGVRGKNAHQFKLDARYDKESH